MGRVLLASGIDQQGTRPQNTALTTVSLTVICFVICCNSKTSWRSVLRGAGSEDVTMTICTLIFNARHN